MVNFKGPLVMNPFCIYNFCTCNYLHAKKVQPQLPNYRHSYPSQPSTRTAQRDAICERAENPSDLSCSTPWKAAGTVSSWLLSQALFLFHLIHALHARHSDRQRGLSSCTAKVLPPPLNNLCHSLVRGKSCLWNTSFAMLAWEDLTFYPHVILHSRPAEYHKERIS